MDAKRRAYETGNVHAHREQIKSSHLEDDCDDLHGPEHTVVQHVIVHVRICEASSPSSANLSKPCTA